MEKEANQLYRRPQMTEQTRDEEEEDKVKVYIEIAAYECVRDIYLTLVMLRMVITFSNRC